jgi:hypothetical protein
VRGIEQMADKCSIEMQVDQCPVLTQEERALRSGLNRFSYAADLPKAGTVIDNFLSEIFNESQ